MQFAVIGGTGFYDFLGEGAAALDVTTRYGTVQVDRGLVEGIEVAFVPRHGREHSVPPHRVNYRANIAALQQLGVKNVLATAAVGTMTEALPPGSLAVLTQFLDFTKCRHSTFHDGEEGEVVHVDVTDPYCSHLRLELEAAARELDEPLRPSATYVCAEGPRFETPAEIRMFRMLGGDVVGMTNVPEVVLAREAGLCYAAVAIITNWAAGMTPDLVKHGEVTQFMDQQTPRLVRLFRCVVRRHVETECPCRERAAG
jgi:5'-methylthioadenosine phosphorylase